MAESKVGTTRNPELQRASDVMSSKDSEVRRTTATDPHHTSPGADGTRISFFLLATPGASKVLIELYEPTPRLD